MDNPIRSAHVEDGVVTVTVAGEIDYSNADHVSRGIGDALAEWSPRTVRVDLRGATFIDSTGLGALILGYRAVTDAGGTFLVVDPTPGFRRVLSLTGLCELFGVSEEPDEARVRVKQHLAA